MNQGITYRIIKRRYMYCMKHDCAMGAFNFCNSDLALAIANAAVRHDAPIILESSSGEMNHMTAGMARGIVDGISRIRKNLAILHLDHGKSIEDVMTAIKAGYDSVHFDGSALPFQDNLKLTRRAADLAHRHGLWIEGELGHVGGSSTLHKDIGYDKLSIIKTDPEQARDFVEKTGIDSLACNIGNVHGIWKGLPRIDFKLLYDIERACNVPLVLHGGSGIGPSQIKKAITLGICKMNVNSEMRVAFSEGLRRGLGDKKMYVPTKYLPAAMNAVQRIVEKKIVLLNSKGLLRKI